MIHTDTKPVPSVNGKKNRSICVILNDRAKENSELHAALETVRSLGNDLDMRPICIAGEAVELAHDAAVEGFDVILASGGDGTLNEVVNGAIQSGRLQEMGLGVIPTGTANDFATQCCISLDTLPDYLARVVKGEAVPIDVGKVNDRYFINLASGGYGAEVTTETPVETKHLLGGFAYFLTGLSNIFNLSAKEAHVATPDLDWNGALLALTVGNGRQAGGGIKACPQALLNDGLFDVLIIPEVQPEELLLLFRDFIRLGKPVDRQYVQYLKAPWLSIDSENDIQVNLDGEPTKSNRFHFELIPAAVPFFLPPNPLLNGSVPPH